VLPRVRPLTPVAGQLVRAGSPTFRELLRDIETTDLIVLIETGRWEQEEGRCHASLRLQGATSETRFVRIWVDAWWRSRLDQAALLAHELQHALEIGLAPEVRTKGAVEAFYGRIGRESDHHRFETVAARRAGAAVCAELGGSACQY
jgi:hypothetical protein